MVFEPEFEKIKYTCKKQLLKEQIKTECKTDVIAEDLASVLNVTAWAVITENDLSSGQVEYGGKVMFYVSYLDNDGLLKKCECASEFKGSIKGQDISPEYNAFVTAQVDKSSCDLSGARLVVEGYVTITAQVTACGQAQAFTGGENVIVKKEEIPIVKSCGVKKGIFPIEEEFEINYPIQEVLSHRARAIVTAVQCGVGAIIVDGEVLLSAIMLQKNQNNDIIKENKNLPFRIEIECEDAMPNMQATARAKERSHKIDVSVDEENGKSVLSASVSLFLEGEAFYDQTLSVATDAFSTENDLDIVKNELPFFKVGEIRSLSANISNRAETQELPVGAIVLAVGGESAEIVDKRCDGDKLIVNGVVNAVVYLKEVDGKVFTRRIETPFESVMDCAFDTCVDLEVRADAYNGRAKIVSIDQIDFDAEIIFTVYPQEVGVVKVIGEVKSLDKKKVNVSPISVYIATEGEELWSLAKRLNVCPEMLVATNKDLQFPLTGKERIVIFRQK